MQASSTAAVSGEAFVARLSAAPLDVAALIAEVQMPSCGGLVLFSGTVRNTNHGKAVARLEYEAHEALATRTMREIFADASERWPIRAVACVHRTGVLMPGEPAVHLVTLAIHRAEAYEANQYIMRRVKHEAAIWKKEVYADGSHLWGHHCDH